MSMHYFREHHCRDGSVMSVDMMTVDGKFFGRPDDCFERFRHLVIDVAFLDFEEWYSFKVASYKHQILFTCSNGCTFWVGFGFNSPARPSYETAGYWRIEFNPNKVFDEYLFLRVYLTLLKLSRLVTCKRFDFAIDYPISRSSCSLIKDGRTYSEYCNSLEDCTQSLGTHNHHGHVKLYNKQLESKLPVPLTRLELTVDYTKRLFDDVRKIFPTVYVVDDLQMRMDSLKLKDTDCFILLACLENPTRLKMLGRKKKEKIESILQQYSRTLNIERNDYRYIISLLGDFVNLDFVWDKYGSIASEVAESIEQHGFYQDKDFEDCTPEEIQEYMAAIFL